VKIEITERQPVKVACLRYTGPFGEPLGRFWRGTVTPWLADHGLVDCPRYGVTLDNPRATPPEKCRYEACVELPPGLTLPDAAESIIPGGRYAVVRFRGTGAQIGSAWSEFGHTLSGTADRIDSQRHPFEHYPRGATYDVRSGVFACELCLPLTN
jgi:AraC family transcriptional regulator